MLFVCAATLGLALAVARLVTDRPAQADRGRIDAGTGLRWWSLAAAGIAGQLCLTSALGMQLAGPWRLAALWTTHAALATALLANMSRPGMRWLLAGMALNFAVMAANGGLMPVSPETLVRGGHGHLLARTAIGGPLPSSKDVVLLPEQTQLELLSDRIVVPFWRGSFSLGDGLIAAGIVFALYAAGGEIRRAPVGVNTTARAGPVRTWGRPMVT